jgi:alpha-tubulin suppressor-like RCC1 family protein
MRSPAVASAFFLAALAGCGRTLFDAQHVPAQVPVCTSQAEPVACVGAPACVAEDDRHCGGSCNDCLANPVQHGTAFCDVSGPDVAQHACVTACAPGFVNDPNGPGCICDAGQVACGDAGACVVESPASCGAACQSCAAPAGATATCAQHACSYVCPAGKLPCANAVTGDADCCAAPCGAGQVLCGGACVSESSAQCGQGCVDCNATASNVPANASVACLGPVGQGACDFACAPGFLKVGGACARIAPGPGAVALGATHTCVITDGGAVLCWGANGSGQLGLGDAATRLSPAAVPLAGGATAVWIAAGASHTCAVTSAGGVQCWGSNQTGQLGVFGPSASFSPVAVAGLTAIARVAAGAGHTCALAKTGDVSCWGDNAKGQLGIPVSAPVATPTHVNLQGASAAVATQGDHTCALKAPDAHVLCWGANAFGQTGQSPSQTPSAPGAVNGLLATAIAVGGSHTCAIGAVNSGATGVYCWGDRGSGQLGDGATSPATSVPTLAARILPAGGKPPAAVLAGRAHTCASAGADGAVVCAGANSTLQAGGDAPASVQPQGPVLSLGAPIADLQGGGDHGCAVAGGALQCWGANDHGQLGTGTTLESGAPVSPRPF